MSRTSIQWTDHSINPIRARRGDAVGHYCEKISPGCASCYASRLQARFKMPPYEKPKQEGVEVFFDDSKLEEVLRRRKATKFFWCDMTDLFGEWVPDTWLDRCFAAMALTPHLTHQLVTKRPERAREYLSSDPWDRINSHAATLMHFDEMPTVEIPLPNVWLLASVENQPTACERIPELIATPAAVRGLSLEPLLGPINLRRIEFDRVYGTGLLDALTGEKRGHVPNSALGTGARIDWLVVGGESGPGARLCDVRWVRSLRNQAHATECSFFFKQAGAYVIDANDQGFEGEGPHEWPADTTSENLTADGWQGDPDRILLRDRKGGDPSEWPEDLRVREFPS